MRIHHGRRFYSNLGINKPYRGGVAPVYVDGVDLDTIFVIGFNNWAADLGYKAGPIMYWFRIPGANTIIDIYIVCLSPRKQYQEWELEDGHESEVDHFAYFGHSIDDFPLSAIKDEEVDLVHKEESHGSKFHRRQGRLFQGSRMQSNRPKSRSSKETFGPSSNGHISGDTSGSELSYCFVQF